MDITVDQVISISTGVIAVASVVASITPTPVDNGVLIVLRKVLDALALNVRHAKNAEQVDAEKFKR